MKKFLSMLVIICIATSSVVASAQFAEDDFVLEEQYSANSSQIELMEGVDAAAELEARLLNAWTNFETEVDISDLKILKQEIADMYGAVWMKHPQFYYVERGFGGSFDTSSGLMGAVRPRYTMERAVVEENKIKIDEAAEEILLYINPEMSDVEKVLAVHDYMVLNYEYNVENPDQTMMMILTRNGVCAGYAKAFLYMMNILGINCRTVETLEDIIPGHMWNMVEIDGMWYHIDLTKDDPVEDRNAMVGHEFALVSQRKIIELGNWGFDASGFETADTYDNAPWKGTTGCVVSLNGIMYYISGNNLVDEEGRIIYKELDGGDGIWHIEEFSGFTGYVFAGLCELNGKLYFNTESAIYSYDPKTEVTEHVADAPGICGLYADENVLVYNAFDDVTGSFTESGRIEISKYKFAKPYTENGKAVVRLYNDGDEPVWVFSKGAGVMRYMCDKKGVNAVKFENGEEQEIFVWDSTMRPILDKMTVK